MGKNRSATRILLIVLLLPLLVFGFMYKFTEQNFERLPFEYDLVENGDTVFHRIPDDVFNDVSGETFTSEDLKGNLVFIDFFSVREDSLKLTTVLHGNLRRTYNNIMWDREPAIRFISINTGDDLDEIEAHRASLEAEAPGWRFVTVSAEDLQRLGDAFQIPAFGKWSPGNPGFTAQTVPFLDKEGFVRKYFVGTDLAEERKMQEDIISIFRMEYPEDLEESRDRGDGLFDYFNSKKL